MRRALIVALLVGVVFTTQAQAQTWPLNPGSTGPRVAALQWMLSGHRPNVFMKVKPTLHRYTPGIYGARTKAAVLAYKFRIGYPLPISPEVGPYFFAILKGHVNRPLDWIINAARRVKAVVPGISAAAQRIRSFEQSQLGVSENTGYNRGTTVDRYQRYFGVLGLAWCVIFQQYSFLHSGLSSFAGRSFGVFYVVEWARYHGYLNAKAKVGALVAYLSGQGHLAFVAKVTASGYVTIAGNESNRVNERFHFPSDRSHVFIYIPGVA